MRKSDLVFFLSGLAALVDQTVWARLLARHVGSDRIGVALVLAIFMGGLAIGAHLGGDLARRHRAPLRLLVTVEILLALIAGLSPYWLALLPPVGSPLARGGLAGALLLGPTILMGMTFPLMGRLTVREESTLARETSAFYGANTLGAALGALAGPFLFMPLLGLSGALVAAGGIELAAAGLAATTLSDPPPRPTLAPARLGLGEPLGLSVFLLGAAGLGLEILLTRLLVILLGASIHAFGIVLAIFLAGIALGSRWIDPQLAGPDAGADERLVAYCGLALAPLTLAGLALLAWRSAATDLFAGAVNRMPRGASITRLWLGQALLSALALLPPTLALGRALPSAVAALARRRRELGSERALAGIYTANTIGALVGALVTAFLLLPLAGLRGGIALLLVLPFLSALCLPEGRRRLPLGLVPALLLGWFVLRPTPPPTAETRLFDGSGPLATVQVSELDGVRSLRVNGKVVATSAPVDLRLQRLLGYLPGLQHGGVRRALCIGLGTGTTAGSLLDLPELKELDVVELSAVVPRAAAYFDPWSGAPCADPRTTLSIADGRHFLARTRATWDLITADPIHPWTAGSSDLYALEHFRNMRAALAPGGVASQWLPLYQLSEEDVRTVMATWCAAFEETSAWLTAYDLVLIGSAQPLASLEELAQRPLPARVARGLAEIGLHSAAEIVGLLVADDADLRAYAGQTPPMRDDRPVLEFRAPQSYLSGYSVETLRWAGRETFVPRLPQAARSPAHALRAALMRFLDRLPQGWSEAARRYGEELLAGP